MPLLPLSPCPRRDFLRQLAGTVTLPKSAPPNLTLELAADAVEEIVRSGVLEAQNKINPRA